MINTKLMGHQEKIVNFTRDKEYSAIFSDYGTGKTLCALAHIQVTGVKKILVISTKTSVVSTWVDEINTHTNFKYMCLIGSRTKKLQLLDYGFRISQISAGYYHSTKQYPIIFLLNFDGLKNIINELMNIKFDLVILDESTKVKSVKTLRTKLAWALGKSAKTKIIMTGFPVTEALHDIYAQVKFLDGGLALGTSYYHFMDTYFVKYGSMYLPKKKMMASFLEKLKPFCIRVTNESLRLPPKIYKQVKVEKTLQQSKVLEQLNSLFQLEFGKVKIDTQYIFTLIAKSLQISDGFVQDQDGNLEVIDTNKDDALLDLLDDIDIRQNKIIIWCTFRFSVVKIQKLIQKFIHSLRYNVSVLTLTGATKNVNLVVNQFQNSPTHNVLIAIQKKGSASITLTSCKYAIYYSNAWSYDERYNSEARIYRKGSEKHKNVIYTDLLVKGTIDERVYQCLRKKKSLVDMLKNDFLHLS